MNKFIIPKYINFHLLVHCKGITEHYKLTSKNSALTKNIHFNIFSSIQKDGKQMGLCLIHVTITKVHS